MQPILDPLGFMVSLQSIEIIYKELILCFELIVEIDLILGSALRLIGA